MIEFAQVFCITLPIAYPIWTAITYMSVKDSNKIIGKDISYAEMVYFPAISAVITSVAIAMIFCFFRVWVPFVHSWG